MDEKWGFGPLFFFFAAQVAQTIPTSAIWTALKKYSLSLNLTNIPGTKDNSQIIEVVKLHIFYLPGDRQ